MTTTAAPHHRAAELPVHRSLSQWIATGPACHLGPALRGTCVVLGQALAQAGAMSLLTPPPSEHD
jgi:hypothetical protein